MNPTAKVITALCTFISLAGPAIADNESKQATTANASSKPLVINLYDKNCQPWNEKITPIITDLSKEYESQVQFINLDVTGGLIPEKTKTQAKELGVATWLKDALDYVPVVGFFNARHRLVKEIVGPKSKDEYKHIIDKILTGGL